jgi:hypothetical protein
MRMLRKDGSSRRLDAGGVPGTEDARYTSRSSEKRDEEGERVGLRDAVGEEFPVSVGLGCAGWGNVLAFVLEPFCYVPGICLLEYVD